MLAEGGPLATLTVRNVDPESVGRLEERARRTGRSMESEIRQILQDAVRDPRAALERIDALERARGGGTTAEDVDA